MNAISYKQLRAFAAQYGAVVGLMWIVSFAFYIIGLTRPLVSNVGLIIGLLSVVTAGFLIRKFRGEVFPLRFGQSWWMATLIFMYASLLMAVAQFVYFRYIDNGLLLQTYSTIMQQPEAVAMMQSMMPGEDAAEVSRQVIDLLKSISPIQLTFEFLVYNLMFGFLLAIPTAWIGLAERAVRLTVKTDKYGYFSRNSSLQ